MKGPEAKIKDEIRKWLAEQGAYVFSPVQMGYGKQTVDLLVCWKGFFVAIEVKAPGKKLTNRQYLILDEIANTGGITVIANGLADLRFLLDMDEWDETLSRHAKKFADLRDQ